MSKVITEPEAKSLRPGVVAVLFDLNSTNVFVGHIYKPNAKIPHDWSTVEGGIDVKSGEAAWEAARRELFEEISLKNPIFMASLAEPITYAFDDDHPRYSGKSLSILFYGLVGQQGMTDLDLDPPDIEEEMAFTTGKFVDPAEARHLLKIGATDARQEFCDRLSDRIDEVYLAMQALSIQLNPDTEDFVRSLQADLIQFGDGYIIEEENTPFPPTQFVHPIPRQPSSLALAAGKQRKTIARLKS